MLKIFEDTETCGKHGPIVIIQYAIEDGPVTIYEVWRESIEKTMKLIEFFCENCVIGFNMSFEWFHFSQLYTTLSMFKDKSVLPEDHIDEYYEYEEQARFLNLCIKPRSCFDVMLHARKGPYQSTMNRKDIRIKRIPKYLAKHLAEELTKGIPLSDILFARKQNKKVRWEVTDIIDDLGLEDPNFKDVVLKFAPSSALKALAEEALGVKDATRFSDIDMNRKMFPEEYGFAPFGKAVGKHGNSWYHKIGSHIAHWAHNTKARTYALDDVVYTRDLYKFFGCPETNDVDSILACMVGSVRWHGFAIDIPKIKKLKQESIGKMRRSKVRFNSPIACRAYLEEVLEPVERMVLKVNDKVTTKSIILEDIEKWRIQETCQKCRGEGCESCEDGFVPSDIMHPAAIRASEILEARRAKKVLEVLNKLLFAGRFHTDLNVIGTKSNRMSGSGGLNPQGINHSDEVRDCFTFADPDRDLSIGDFVSFEVVLMDAAYGDPVLRKELMSGKKIHGLFGVYLFEGKTYEDIMKSKGTGATDLYDRSKRGVFCVAYGGNEHSLVNRVGILLASAVKGYEAWVSKYKVWGQKRKDIFTRFCTMTQPKGIGTKVQWSDPAEYVESMFGFRRYFTLENKICKFLFNLANNIPEDWKKFEGRVIRRDREQTIHGALSSALYGAAFGLQAANMRAAANHEIQSPGATITKELQHELWQLQPHGVNEWVIQLLNIHDELIAVSQKGLLETIENIVRSYVEDTKSVVPLLDIDWKSNVKSWKDK